ncbi:MAG: hypothetical protein GY802_00015, partial [Gammaproteobacteria bacterium]|nr:hypothetical protein [Gammaproteobacteria bacterium]
DYGIDIWSGGPSNNTIGGATSDLRNIISGNGWAGIHISGTSATGNQVLGNYIGTDITGTAGIANGTGAISGGIDINSGADNNIIGGAGTGNLIAYNTGPGVRVDGSGTSGNAIRENEIHSNTGIGIDQVSSGNQGRQDPSLSSVVTDGAGSVSVGGSYSDSATAGQTLTIEYFSNPGNDREGKIYLDSDTFVTDGSGNATISSEISATVSAGEYVTATVTDASGNTSEFSVAQAAVANGPPTADSGGPYTISEGGTLTLDASASSDADGSITAWDWDIGDNGSFEKSGETISYNWADLNSAGVNDDGSFDVALRVTDNNGATDTQVFTLNVDNTAPTLSVSGAVSADEDTAYSFDLIFTDPGSETLTWFVNWGDGTLTNHAATGNTTSVSHVYQDWNNGFTRNITVSASDEDGAYTLSDLLATGIGNGYGNGASDGIFRFDGVTGSFISAFDDPAQISDPIELIMGPDGKYYVSGYNSDNILRFNADGSYFDEFVSPNLGGLISPTGIAFGPSGKLYVASEGTNEILRYYANGSFDKVFGTSGGGMDEPGGITFGPDGDLYATSWNSSEIYMYDGTDGGLPTLVIGSGLSGPEQIYFDADGDLFIADTSNDRIARYDGLSLTTFTSGTAPVKSGGLVVGPDGSWYAASRTGDSVLKYDAAGNFDSVFVSTGEGGLNGPLYLAFTPAHQVLVNPVNDEPTLTATGGDPTFTEDGAAAGLFSGAIVDTIESGQTLKGLTLTVTNVNDGSNEILNIDGSAIALTNGNSGATASLNYNVNVSVTGTGTTATVVLSGGTLSTAATQTLVDGLSYQNNSNDPNTSNRVVTLTELVDSGGTANSGDDTAALSVASTVTVQKANDAPTLANNTLTLNQGQTITLDSSMLSATDVDTTNSNLTFTVSGVSNGHFAYGLTPATPITSFTQAQVIAGDVVFVHDGGELAPAFDVTVADAEPLSDGPISATINFSGTNAGVLWLSTVGDESGAHGVPGLDASGWQDSDVLQQANPNLSFGEADTDGTFSIAFDASNFAINPAVNGIHYVASDVTVGATNPIDLQAGDLLLTTQNTKTFTSNGAGAPGSLSVNKEDIFYFRPDTPGDYSSGNFYMLLTDPFGGSKEIRGLTLVEKDVWLGDYWLREGDLLLSRAGAAEENDIWVMKTDTLNTQFEGSYQGLQQVLIEGDDAGVDLEDKIYGLDVLEVATTIGGKSYNSGTILVSIDADDTDGIGSTSQQATPNDIVALTINRTNLGSGASLAQIDASLMFDGDDVSNNDVNFDSNNEEINGLTLTSAPVASNATPTLGNNALTLNEGETVTVTTTMLSATDADNVDSGLVFNLSVVSGGQFELTGDPGNAVTSFTQQQISDSELVFIDNGDESAPTFNVSVSDGSAATTPVAGVVNFTNVNDEPSLTATSSNPTFTEGGSATSLFSGTSVDTVESGQTLTGLTLTVTNVNDGANEILNIDGAAIALTNGNSGSTTNLSYSVVVSGTDATVTLTGGTLSTAATQTLVDAISYQNNSNDPDTSDRVVTLTELVDSGGTANSGDDTAALSITSTVT